MVADAGVCPAWKLDERCDARVEISMVKAFATEMAWAVVDRAM